MLTMDCLDQKYVIRMLEDFGPLALCQIERNLFDLYCSDVRGFEVKSIIRTLCEANVIRQEADDFVLVK